LGDLAVRTFLTGASGFIGAHVLRELLAGGHKVAALIVPEDRMLRLSDYSGQFTVFRGFLGDTNSWRQALEEFKPEACVHLAWFAEPGQYLDSPENIHSLTASIELLEALISIQCRQVVMAGTCAEYDAGFGYLHEDTPALPATMYAASKLACCHICLQMARKAGINLAWARIFYPYGPQEDERRIIPSAIRALRQGRAFPSTPGGQVRDYIHVEDVATAFRTLLEKESEGVFNIASGIPVAMRALLQAIGDMIGRADLLQFGKLPYREWDPAFICGDNTKLKKTGWAPRISLDRGLRQTIEWWAAHDPV